MSWGNSDNTTNNQDMESPVGYHLYATENSSTDPAIKGHNNNSSGVAIHSDGRLQVDGQVLVDTGAAYMTSVSITNGTGAYALDIAGKVRVTKDYPATALQVSNPDESPSGFALHASGKVLADYGGVGDAVKIAHSDPTELALNVDGMARIRKTTAAPYSILEVINDGEGGAIHADGKLQVDGDSDLNGNLQVDGNSNLNGTLQVVGDSNLNGNLDVSGTLHTDTIVGSSGNLIQVANVDHGSVNLGNATSIDSLVKTLCPLHCNGYIDTISAVPLRIGQSYNNNASSIELARSGINTFVRGSLYVDDHVSVDGILDLDADGTGAAMDVTNSNGAGTAVGISATGRTALQSHGHIALDSDKNLNLDGTTAQNYMKYNSAQARIEFYIGGSLAFYIDSHGGHNP